MSNHKYYDLGVICGRFGPTQIGHVSLFDTSLALCKRTLILVGSAQEYGTLRNPFPVETRIDLIKEIYPGESEQTLTIRGINDLKNEFNNTTSWGKYFKAQVISHKHKFADLMVYGDDNIRSSWFDAEDLVRTSTLIIPRTTIPISGTEVRGLLVIDDETAWQKVSHPFTHGMYERLREEIMNVPVYKEIYNSIYGGDMSLDSFMKVYKEFEIKDREDKLAQLQKL